MRDSPERRPQDCAAAAAMAAAGRAGPASRRQLSFAPAGVDGGVAVRPSAGVPMSSDADPVTCVCVACLAGELKVSPVERPPDAAAQAAPSQQQEPPGAAHPAKLAPLQPGKYAFAGAPPAQVLHIGNTPLVC